jgi:hypothetical protein
MMQYSTPGLNQLTIPAMLPTDWRYVQEKSDVQTKVPEDVKQLEQLNKSPSNSTNSTELAQMFPGDMSMMYGGMN